MGDNQQLRYKVIFEVKDINQQGESPAQIQKNYDTIS